VLPFIVEEQLIEPVETAHIVTPVLIDGETVPVIVIAKALLASWLDWLAEIELAPDYLFLDACCLPNQSGSMQVMVDGENVLVRASNIAACLCPPRWPIQCFHLA
jgi:type II secretory pathway component PulL